MKRINYHHLYYFWRIATVGKLTDVALELHISQSALSTQIKQLEEQVGFTLFTRRNRQLILTEAGKQVLAYAEDIFALGGELEHLIHKGITAETQHLSIGVLSHLSRNFVEHFVSPLLAMDKVSFSLTASGLDNLLKGLSNHTFDLILTNCVVADFDTNKHWNTQLVSQQPIAIVGANKKKPQRKFPDGYETMQWIVPDKETEIRSAFESWCAINNFRATIKAESNDMAMLRLLARDSDAIAVLPPVVVKDEIAQGAVEIYEYIPNTFENFYAISAHKKNTPALISQLLQSALYVFNSYDE